MLDSLLKDYDMTNRELDARLCRITDEYRKNTGDDYADISDLYGQLVCLCNLAVYRYKIECEVNERYMWIDMEKE